MAVVSPTDPPKSVRNRCVIGLFCGVVWVVTLPFWHFCWCRGFWHRTESELFLLPLSKYIYDFQFIFKTTRRKGMFKRKYSASTQKLLHGFHQKWSGIKYLMSFLTKACSFLPEPPSLTESWPLIYIYKLEEHAFSHVSLQIGTLASEDIRNGITVQFATRGHLVPKPAIIFSTFSLR